MFIHPKKLKVYSSKDFPKYLPKLNALYDDLFHGGKGFRAQLIQRISKHLDLTDDTILLLSQSIEFIHNASLLHDDLIDRSQLRRHKTAAWLKYSPEYAVLAGDYLLARVIDNLSDFGNIKLLQHTSRTICELLEGEWMQDSIMHDWNISSQQLDQVHKLKTASLFSWCLRAPFMASDYNDEKLQDTLSELGTILGFLFQRSDDLLDYDVRNNEGKAVLGDLKSGYLNSFGIYLTKELDEHKRQDFIACTSMQEVYDCIGQDYFDTRLKAFDDENQQLIQKYDEYLQQLKALLPLKQQKVCDELAELSNKLYWRNKGPQSEIVTVSKQDSRFSQYLNGTFSKALRALPLMSFNVNTVQEKVSFRILSTEQINQPSWLMRWLKTVRMDWLCMSLSPLITTLLFTNYSDTAINGTLAASGFLAVAFLHSSINLMKEYYDHIQGKDRLSHARGSRSIQKGWLRARDVQIAAWLSLAVAIACSLPILMHQPWLALAVIAFSTSIYCLGKLNKASIATWSEMGVLLLLGPILCGAYAWTISQQIHPAIYFIGLCLGSLAALVLFTRHLEYMIGDAQSGSKTLPARLGFAKARYVSLIFIGLAASSLAYAFFNTMLWPGIISMLAILIVPTAIIIKRIFSADSALNSSVQALSQEALRLYIMASIGLNLSLLLSSMS